MTSRRQQQGMSLIELMIAMVIGLMLMAGLIQVFITGKSSYGLQEKMGDLQENGRFALYFLQRDIRMAGYPKNDATVVAFDPGKSTDGSGSNSDRVSIRYRAPVGGTVDCAGASKAAGQLIQDTFSITVSDGISRLSCEGNAGNGNQPLVDGIENMQVHYGVDTDVSGTAGWGYANFYAPANQLTSAQWPRVVSVRIAILASTVEPLSDEDAGSQAQNFTLLDVSGLTLSDPKVRGRVFTTTIELRNRTSGI